MRLLSTGISFFIAALLHAQPFNWQWSRSATCTVSLPFVQGMVTDVNGNSYLTGIFQGTATFGSLPAITSVGQSDVFVVKYDHVGNALWVAHGGGNGVDWAHDVAIDAAGHVYITGYFQSASATFGGNALTLQGATDIFCARLDGTTGGFFWAKRFGGNDNATEEGDAIACDANGNVYLTGHFRYYLTVPGLATLNGCSTYYTSFLLKLDADGNGVWSVRPECGNGFSLEASEGQALAVDALGGVYMGFRYRGDSLFIANDTLVNPYENGQTHDGVLAKYDADGNYQWARRLGSSGYDDVEALAVDGDGRCYVAMHREGSYHMCAGTDLSQGGSQGTYSNVLLKLDANGDCVWGQRMGNSTWDHNITGLVLDSEGHLFLGGWFDGNFEIGGVEPTSTAPGLHALYVARMDTSGALEEVFAARHYASRGVRGIGLDGSNNLYVAGDLNDSLDMAGIPTLHATAGALFVARSGDLTTSVPDARTANAGVGVYPVPSNGSSTIRSPHAFTAVRITDAVGRVVLQRSFPPTTLHTIELTTDGVYFYTLSDGDAPVATGRVVVQR